MTHRNGNSPKLYPGCELVAMADKYRYQRWMAEQFLLYLHGNVMEIGAVIGTIARMFPQVRNDTAYRRTREKLFLATFCQSQA